MSSLIQSTGTVLKPQKAERYETLDGLGVQPQWLTLWPNRPFLIPGDWSNPIMQFFDAPDYWTFDPQPTGTSTKKLIAGYTRNAAGTPVGGVTVKAFRTTDDVLEQTVVSNNSTNVGYFEIYVSTTGNHYLVGELAGSPDTSGATDNNLAGV